MTTQMIGILGGAGVWASASLVARINALVSANGAIFDQEHPELILLHATQAPSRSLWLEGRGPSFLPAYIEAAQRLKGAGAGFVAMCCNTAHVLRDEIEAGAGIKVLDLVKLAAKRALDIVGKKGAIGILESDGSRCAGLYRKMFNNLGTENTIIELDDGHQKLLTKGIVAAKRGFHLDLESEENPRDLVDRSAQYLVQQGADCVVLGCTELPLAFPKAWKQCPVVDTIEVLAQACLRESGLAGKWS